MAKQVLFGEEARQALGRKLHLAQKAETLF